MTKELWSMTTPANLDSFLDSYSSSDESTSAPHRTVDEILNASDSSSRSNSPPSSPPSFRRYDRSSDLHKSDQFSPPGSRQDHAVEHESAVSNSSPFTRVLDQFRASSSSSSNSKSSKRLPLLFGGVRSNAKPGAAFAAAVAASRSVPTPHADIIKSKRAISLSSGTLQKVLDGSESISSGFEDQEISSSNGDSVDPGINIFEDGYRTGDFQSSNQEAPQSDDIESVGKQIKGFVSNDKLVEGVVSDDKEPELEETMASDVAGELLDNGDSKSNAERESVDLSASSLTYLVDGFTQEEGPAKFDTGNITSETAESQDAAPDTTKEVSLSRKSDYSEESSIHSPEFDKKKKKNNEASITTEESAGYNLDKVVPTSSNDPVGVDNAGDGEDGSWMGDISELVEERIEQLENERKSREKEKKSLAFRKPLILAEEFEKKQAYTGLHWEEGAAAQPMRLEGVKRGSTTLGYFDVDSENLITRTVSSQTFRRDHGSPQVLAVHLNYVAVGMSKGVIVVVPSKYSANSADQMDHKIIWLGLQGDRSLSPVTSMCFNPQGDLLLAGYGDGHVTVWDVQKASPAKVITGEHTAPVLHTLFLGRDSQGSRQFKAITGDSKGLVFLHTFSAVLLLNMYSVKTQCLLDGQKNGTVLSASPLLLDESCGSPLPSSQCGTVASSGGLGSMMGGVVGGEAGWKLFNENTSVVDEGVVIFVTYQTALVVRLSPNLEVYAQLSRPEGVREGSMPYTAWKCTMQTFDSSAENSPKEVAERVSLLAVAWDRKVQVAKLIKSEVKVYAKWSLDNAAIGVAWLDDQMLVIPTVTGHLYMFAKDGTLIHQTNFSVDGSAGDDLISHHTYFRNVFGNPEKAHHNCVAVRGASIYILGSMHLVVSRLLPWKERISVLRRAGDWMGALNMGMMLYDGQAHGVVDLPKTVGAVQEIVMPYLVELILYYVDEVFSYISVAFGHQLEKPEQSGKENSISSKHSEIKEQYNRVGGVAVEFCVHVKRMDLLFDEIFSKFVAVHQRDTFLELLEPYILKDMLGSLPPEIMQALVEHYSSKGWLQRVEQCVLHMDISSLDFNQVVRICREHGLYGALVYLFNQGLDDFRSPLEELLTVLRNSQRQNAAPIGYRMLVYLKYCFLGLAFPPGRGSIPPTRLPSLRTELVHFLLENSKAQDLQVISSSMFGGVHLNLYFLLELDTEATLDVLRCAFQENETAKYDISQLDSDDIYPKSDSDGNGITDYKDMLVQDVVDVLVHILDVDLDTVGGTSDNHNTIVETWPSKEGMGHLFEFVAYYVASGKAVVPKRVVTKILGYLTSVNNFPENMPLKRRENQLLNLLKKVPENEWDATYAIELCEKARFYQVCGFIHTIGQQYLAALDSYMKDAEEPIHAFCFVNTMLSKLHGNELAVFRSAIISRMPELFGLSREGTFFLIIDHLKDETTRILSELHSNPRSLFLYLKTVIEVHSSGTLDFSSLRQDETVGVSGGSKLMATSDGLEAYMERLSEFSKLYRSNPVNVTDDMMELYLELLCKFERNSVLKFLETFDSYRVERCLRLCQEYGIIDAAAFLLERVGDAASALSLTLSGLDKKFAELESAMGIIASNLAYSKTASFEQQFSSFSNLKEVRDIQDILHACIGLCQRNTPRLNHEESETLWFRLLDTFCEPLMDSYHDKSKPERKSTGGLLVESLGFPEDQDCYTIKWKIPKSHAATHILRKLFSKFIKEIVEGMIGYVHLLTIMSKLLSENGGQEFGDFKLTILGMLGTYGFERRILDTAKSLIEDDTFYTMSLLKKGASHGYAPRNFLCCICNCPLYKYSSSLRIRVFNCGHATHLHCEPNENETSNQILTSGCPLCTPKKNVQASRNKSVYSDYGLVSRASSNTQRPQRNSPFSYENDSADNSYGPSISRFEILTNLQKDQTLSQIESTPPLRLAPPAVYHEKVNRGNDIIAAESSQAAGTKKPARKGRGGDLKFKAPFFRTRLGKEKTNRR